MTTGPSAHLAWSELACVNRLTDAAGHPVPFAGVPPGWLVAPYPLDLRASRGATLGAVFEAVREACGGHPITVTSAYRTPAYDKAVGGASAYHPRGMAIDMATPEGMTAAGFAAVIRSVAQKAAKDIGGLGLYDWGCHIDIRPRGDDGAIVRWDYRGRK